MSLAREITEWVVGGEFEEVPLHARDRASLSVLDTLGVIAASLGFPLPPPCRGCSMLLWG